MLGGLIIIWIRWVMISGIGVGFQGVKVFYWFFWVWGFFIAWFSLSFGGIWLTHGFLTRITVFRRNGYNSIIISCLMSNFFSLTILAILFFLVTIFDSHTSKHFQPFIFIFQSTNFSFIFLTCLSFFIVFIFF